MYASRVIAQSWSSSFCLRVHFEFSSALFTKLALLLCMFLAKHVKGVAPQSELYFASIFCATLESTKFGACLSP